MRPHYLDPGPVISNRPFKITSAKKTTDDYLSDLCTSLGIPVNEGDDSGTRHTWNGDDFMFDYAMSTQDICHEIAHWLVAPPLHRRICDFGLGLGQYSHRKLYTSDPRRATLDKYRFLHQEPDQDEQEKLAGVLGFFIELEARAVELTFDAQSCDEVLASIVTEADIQGIRFAAPKRYAPPSPAELAEMHRTSLLVPRETLPRNWFDEGEMRVFFEAVVKLTRPPYELLALTSKGQMAFVHRNAFCDRFQETT